MSDEPQPKNPNEGWAPGEPEAGSGATPPDDGDTSPATSGNGDTVTPKGGSEPAPRERPAKPAPASEAKPGPTPAPAPGARREDAGNGEPGEPGEAGATGTRAPEDGKGPKPRGKGTGPVPDSDTRRLKAVTPPGAGRADSDTRQLKAVGAAGAAGATVAAADSGPANGATGTPGKTGGDGSGGPGTGGPDGEKKRKRPKRTGWRRFVPSWRWWLGGFVVLVGLLVGGFFIGYSMVNIPPANALATKQSNVYLYADGTQLARDGEIDRENVTLSQVSEAGQHAVLAAEDRDFYTESAVDPKAMIRAAWNTVTGKGKQSGSTITQQYVKNYYLGQEQTVTRKVKEFFISIKLDREESKNQILEGYLNTSYFGRNAYGIQAAAQAYYRVDAKDLDPARAAYLAALLNAPSEYDVVAHPENKKAAEARWNYVLDGMVTKGWITESARAGMKFPMPKEANASTGMSGQRGYIVSAIKDYLTSNKIIDADALDAGGYRITTTLEKTKQDAFVKAVDDQVMSKLDKKSRKVDNYVRAGGASVDPKTGKILAMYGGIDYVKQYTNGATRRDFQVGSTFKPFVFASAVQNGSQTQDGRTITPNTLYSGTNKRPVQGWSGGAYAPENEDGVSYGDITVRTATDKSVNSVYAQMAVDVGPTEVKQTAIGLGLPSGTPDLEPYPSIALGTATASPLDMAEAYATLANHGEHGTYTMVEKITKGGGKEIALPAAKTVQAVSRQSADTTTNILQSVVENGTATAAKAAGRPAAGKTGTAEEDTAAWFAGYTPNLATVVAVMGQDPVTAAHKSLYGAMGLARINGGGAPAQIWAQYTKDALEGTSASGFSLKLQPGANEKQEPTTQPSATAGTGGTTTDGGTTTGGDTTTGGTTGDTTGGTTTDGTTTTGGDTTGTTGDTTGTTTTDGGTTTTGGDTTGTTGDTTGGTTTDGTATTGGGDTGGTDDGGLTTGGANPLGVVYRRE